MTPKFKFLRRVRIHGGECGAVARALHHEAQKVALMQAEQSLISDEKALLSQADSGKALGSTFNERKQMSTKTTLKRIALVAVSALGFGVLSTVPAKAADYTNGITLGWSALTVVGSSSAASNGGFFYVDTTVYDESEDTSIAAGLQSDETLTVSVIAAPNTSTAVTNLDITYVTKVTGAATAVTAAFADGSVAGDEDESVSVTSAATASNNTSFSTTAALNNEANRYWFHVTDGGTAAAIGAGKYTLRVRLQNANGGVIDKTLTVKFVETIADADAVLTLAKTGVIRTGQAYDYTNNTSVRATLRDGDGGRIQLGQARTGTTQLWDPALTAKLVNATDTTSASMEDLTITDAGVTTDDFVECGTGGAAACGTTPTGGMTNALSGAHAAAIDGIYGVHDGAISSDADVSAVVRVAVTGNAETEDIAIAIVAAGTSEVEDTNVLLTAAGIRSSHTIYRDVTATTANAALGAYSLTYTLPLTTTTATLTFELDGLANEAMVSTVTWSGNYASTAVTPASTTATTSYSSASKTVTQTVTNSSPVDGAVATVVLTGFDDASHKVTITLTWAKPAVETVAIVEPISGVYVKTGASTVFTVSVTDQFDNGIANEELTPTIPSTSSANYSATITYASIKTNASGIATWTLTDAAATADSTDGVTFTSVSNSAKSASRTITYKATLPTVSTITNYYADDFSDADTTITSVVPTAGIGYDTARTIVIARDISKDLSANTEEASNDMNAIRVRALTSSGTAATGAAITLTGPTGGWVLNTSGLPASTRTTSVDSAGDAFFRILATAPGTLTFKVLSGTTELGTIKLVTADPTAASARFVTLTGASTGTANGEGVTMTAKVTDRYGNGVKGVTLTATASGVGAFMGGATSQSFTTDATGTYTFLANSYAAAGGSATYSVSASASVALDADSLAGYSGATPIDSTVAAGNAAATAKVTFAAGSNAAQAAAEAATDAAAEAIDAANAATDAANLAAEAADAATVAAEEARDAADAATAAVEELATQVATLMAALKAQITTLANTVAKIAKKVKA